MLSDLEEPTGNCIWINHEAVHEAYRQLKMKPREVGIQATLLFLCCEEGYSMPSDANWLSQRLNDTGMGGDHVGPEEINRLRRKLERFFVRTRDGFWAPSAEFYALNDPNAELDIN